jgi:hypothetical protein
MIELPTPETDAFAIKFKTICGEKYWVPVDTARRLERERDSIKKHLHAANRGAEINAKINQSFAVQIIALQKNCDKMLEALMKIEEVYVDSDDTYNAYLKMGTIARNTLEEIENMNNTTPETDELYERLLAENAGNYIYLAEILPHAKKLELERNKALAKIANQAARIRYLEGATNHACGTPLTEAKEEADKYKMIARELIAAIRINTLRGTWADANIETVETWLKPWLDKLE